MCRRGALFTRRAPKAEGVDHTGSGNTTVEGHHVAPTRTIIRGAPLPGPARELSPPERRGVQKENWHQRKEGWCTRAGKPGKGGWLALMRAHNEGAELHHHQLQFKRGGDPGVRVEINGDGGRTQENKQSKEE